MTYQQWTETFLEQYVPVTERTKARLALRALIACVAGEIRLARLGARMRTK